MIRVQASVARKCSSLRALLSHVGVGQRGWNPLEPQQQPQPQQRSLTSGVDNGADDPQQAPAKCLGYVAGLQSASKDTPWSTFEEAYEILQQVDPDVLLEFETDLWEEKGMKFVHSTKTISVIDYYLATVKPDDQGGGKAVRSLVFNDRPELIQSSIRVNYGRDGSCQVLWGTPAPLVGLTATHLGGLGLAAPLWLAINTRGRQMPHVLVLGAGGCTVPSLLSKAGCRVTAIEPNHDVRGAALEYFGAAEAGITLLPGYGEDYLKETSFDTTEKIDVLIIDAEDGGNAAPPQSMREESFWKDAVLPNLNADAVVAVNVIAEPDTERLELQRIVSTALPFHEVWCCEVPRIANVSNRHCLLFATPLTKGGKEINLNDRTMKKVELILEEFRYVDMPANWMEEMALARSQKS